MNRLLKKKDESAKKAAPMKLAKYKPLSPPREQNRDRNKYRAMAPRKVSVFFFLPGR